MPTNRPSHGNISVHSGIRQGDRNTLREGQRVSYWNSLCSSKIKMSGKCKPARYSEFWSRQFGTWDWFCWKIEAAILNLKSTNKTCTPKQWTKHENQERTFSCVYIVLLWQWYDYFASIVIYSTTRTRSPLLKFKLLCPTPFDSQLFLICDSHFW
jgi:hypothetical protein